MEDRIIRYNDKEPNHIKDGIYHLGVQDELNTFNNIPYLIIEDGVGVLIDPGSAKSEFYEVVKRKIESVIKWSDIKYIIVQHQDPDLCASLPLIEELVGSDCKFYAPLEAQILVQHYGVKRGINSIEDGDFLKISDRRELRFYATPYCHFVGSIITYDSCSKVLFSSDIFGGFTEDNRLFADRENYPTQLTIFTGEYLGSKRAFEYALKRIEQICKVDGISYICPQHGTIIPSDLIQLFLETAESIEVGQQVNYLAKKYKIDLLEGE